MESGKEKTVADLLDDSVLGPRMLAQIAQLRHERDGERVTHPDRYAFPKTRFR